LAMIAAMSYPSVLLYLPSLGLVWLWRVRQSRPSARWLAAQAASGLAGLAVPLALSLTWLRNPRLLVYDSTTHSGLFRGGATGFDWNVLTQSLSTVVGDLFDHGQSYYFEVSRPDYAGLLALLGLVTVLTTTVYLGVTRKVNPTLLAAWGMLLTLSAIVPNLSIGGPPGIRRCTGILAAMFFAFVVTWRHYTALTAGALKWTGIALCLLVPIDSALKLPALLDDVQAESAYRDTTWFAIEATPAQSLARLLARLDRGEGLACPVDDQRRIQPCRYQEIYAAMAGARQWNRLPHKDVVALDWKTGQTITLTPSLWTDYYYPH